MIQNLNDQIFCKICNAETSAVFQATVLKKYPVQYYKCKTCGFIQTEEPYWLDEAYSSAITSLDIGLVSRNIEFAEFVDGLIKDNFNTLARFIDYGGGYGLFVRLMRDKGFDFYRQDFFCDNIFAKHFDISDIPDGGKFELLTAFEVFEHLKDPVSEIKKMFQYSDSVLFSTILQPDEELKSPDQWWYFVPETGQHISFYTMEAVKIIAKNNSCYLYSNNKNIHLLTTIKLEKDPFDAKDNNTFYFRLINKITTMLMFKKRERIMTSLLDKDFNYIKSK